MLASLSIVPAHAAEHPTIIAASVTSATEIVLTYSENIDVSTTDGAGFALSVGQVSANTDPGGSDDTITLTVSGITTAVPLTITYTALLGSVTDTESNPAADQTFDRTTDDAPPTVSSIATFSTSTIDVVLSEDVTVSSVAPEDFVLSGTISTDPTVTGITALNDTVTLSLDDTLAHNDVILLAYTKTTGSIDDIPLPPLLSSFSVDSQDTSPRGLAFSADGTKMFVAGDDGNDINEYTLTTAFDVSTASFVDSFSVSSQDIFPSGLAFSADGTKMFVVGDSGNDINEYTLTTAFDVSTASFVDSFSVSSQDAVPQGLAFSTDGTKMFVIGNSGNNINEYTLTTAFDVSTASYNDKSFSVVSQDTSPRGLAFSGDGTRMFVVGNINDAVYGYTLTTPFDVSTASFVDSFSVASQDTAPRGLALSADGTRIFVLGDAGGNVHQYALSEPFTLFQQPASLASFAAMSVTNNIMPPPAIIASSMTSATSITLTYSEDIDVATTNGQGFSLSIGQVTGNTNPAGSGNTLTLTVSGITNTSDTPAITYTASLGSVTDTESNPAADQTFTGTTDDAPPTVSSIATFSTSTIDVVLSEDVTVSSVAPEDFVLSGTISTDPTVTGITAIADTVTLSLDDTLDDDDVISLAYTKTTGSIDDILAPPSFVGSFSVASQDNTPTGLAFSDDGTKMFVVGLVGTDINEYALTAPFDISTASFVDSFSVDSQDTFPADLAFSDDGTKMFVIGLAGNDINEYALTTAFDVSTASFVDSFQVSQTDISPRSLAFSNDGTKMFVLDIFGGDSYVNEYTLTTPFDVSTVTFVDSFSVASHAPSPQGLAFSDDGTKMFVSSSDNDAVIKYALTAPFDVSTASFVDSFSVSSQGFTLTALAFSDDGTRMFVLENDSNAVYEYALSEPFTLFPQPNSLASFAAMSVKNNIVPLDTVPPTITAAAVTSLTEIVLTYSENIDVTTTNGEGFTLSVGTVSANTDPAGSGNTITLTVSGITTSDTPNVTYIESDGSVTDSSASTSAASQTFTGTTDDAPPTVSSVATAGTSTINIVLSENVTINGAAPEDFALSGTISTDPAVTGITAVTNNAVALALDDTLDSNDAIFLAYTKATGSIDDIPLPPLVGSFPVGIQDSGSTSLAFSNDGTRMFVVGTGSGRDNDAVHQYTLSAAFDVSTASFVDSFSVASQDTVPRGLAFSADGTKMFVVGSFDNNINEYTLSAAFDVSTASFVDSFSVASQDISPRGLAFSGDGTKMFVLGGVGDDINEYTLTAPFDVSNVAGTSDVTFVDSFPVASQDISPRGLAFSADGTRMFVVGSSNDAVYGYTLTIAFDVSTATFVDSFSVASQDTFPADLALSADGTRIFVLGGDGENVHQYALSEPFTLFQQPNSLASFAAMSVTNNIPSDTTPPTITAATVTSLTEIVLTYSENIDVTTTNGEGFTLSVGTVSANTDPDNSDSTITLTVSGITASDAPDVTYTESDGTVADTASNPAASQTFTGTTPLPDTIPPTITAAAVTSLTEIVLTYSENIDVTTTNGEGFTLSTGTVSANSDPDNSDSTITLTVSGIAASDAPDVIYTESDGSVTDGASNPAASQTFTGTTPLPDTIPPTITAAAVTSLTEIVLTYSEDVDVTTTNGEGFTLSDGTVSANTDPAGSDNTITLTVSGITTSDRPDITYSAESGTVTDSASNLAAGQTFTGTTDDAPPTVSSIATFNASAIDIVLSEDVTINGVAPGNFALSGTISTNPTVTGITAFAKTVTLALDDTLAHDDVISLAYAKATGSIDDISLTSFTSSFSVASQDEFPRGLAFSNDGTRMFVVGDIGNDINEYALTAPFDVSTADFDSSFSVNSQDASPRGLAFSNDGTRMFVVGDIGNDVYQYALTAPFDISNANFTSSFSVASQDEIPRGLAFSNDGTRMFVLGYDNNSVYQYALTTAFDVPTATFVDSFPVSSQEISPWSLAFSEDGTRMFVVGTSGTDVNEYALTAPFDISNVTFVDSFPVGSQDASPRGLAFSNDGTRMFVVGDSKTAVHQYALPKPFTLFPQPNSLASFDAMPVTNNVMPPPAIIASSLTSATSITLTYSEDIDVTTTDGQGFTLSVGQVTGNTNPAGSGNTITLTVSGITNTSDTPAITYTASLGSVTDTESNPAADQTFDRTVDDAPPTVSSIATSGTSTSAIDIVLSEDITVISVVPGDFALSGTISTNPTVIGITALADTVTLSLDDTLDDNDVIRLAYTKTTSSIGDILAPPSFVGSFSPIPQSSSPRDLAFSADGYRMFILNSNDDTVYRYALTAPFDVSTASSVGSFSVASEETTPRNLAFSANGTKMFVAGDSGGGDVHQYALAAPFDISNADFVDSFSVSSQDSATRGLAFSNDGTKMFVAGSDNNNINEYTLATPFNISTATFVDSFSVSIERILTDLAFSNDGIRMFLVDIGGDVFQYALAAPFDISNVTFVDSFPVGSQDPFLQGLAFSGDGTRMFALGTSNNAVHEYALSKPFTLRPQPNSLASFAAMSVENNVAPPDTVAPTITAAAVTSVTEIVLTYSENIDVSTTDGEGFTLSDVGTVSANTDPAGSADTITLTVSGITASDAPNVTYTESDGTVADTASNPAASQTFTGTTALPDTIPPTITAAAVTSATSITLTYSENIDVTTTNGAGFTLSTGTVTANTNPAGSGNTITLAVSGITDTSDTPDITYTDSLGTVIDTASNPAASQTFTGTTDDAPPIVSSIATTSTSTIDVVLSEDVTINGAAPGDFALSGTISTNPTVTGITAAADTVTLALSSVLDSNDVINLAYDKTTGSIDDIPAAAPPSFVGSFSVGSQDNTPTGLAFSDDGTKMFVVGLTGIDVLEYTLTAPFDISNVTFVDSFLVHSQNITPTGLAFSADGTKMFVAGNQRNNVNEYILTAPFDVSTSSFVDSFSVSSQDTTLRDVAFSADGTKMFVAGFPPDAVNEYTLATPFDVSTSSIVDSFSVASEVEAPTGLTFSADGTKMFVVGFTSKDVNEYTLATPFDISSAVSVGSFPIDSQAKSPTGLAFSNDGYKMFVVDTGDDNVLEYALSEPFTLLPQPNSLASFAATLVTNNIAPSSDDIDPPIDTTPPTITVAAVTSLTEILLTYSENIDVTTTNGAGFTLSTGTVTANTDPAGSGNTITLTVFGITASDTPAITYTASDGTVTDSASNQAKDQIFADTTALPDTVPPTITAAAVTSAISIVLTYSENIDVTTTDGTGFSLSDGQVTANTDPAGSDDTITLTVSGIAASDTPAISYTASDGTVTDTASNQAANQIFADTTALPDTIPPTITAAAVTSLTEILLTYSENIDVTTTNDQGFALSVGQVTGNTDPGGFGNTITLTVSGITASDAPNVIYTESDGTVADSASNEAEDQIFADTTALPDTVPPEITAAAVTSAISIVLTYSENIDVTTTNGAGFALSDGEVTANTDPAGSDDTITLTVSGITASDAPNVIYTESDGNVEDSASNPAEDQTFTGTTAPPDTIPPTITAAAVTSLTEIVLTYSENIDVTTTNGAGFTLSDGGTVSANTDPGNSGNTITLTVSGITASDAPNVIYTESDGSVTDSASNPAEDQTFAGTTAGTMLTVSSIGTAGTLAIDIVLSEDVTINGAAPEDFALSGTISTDPAVTGITAAADTVTLTLDDTLAHDDVISLAYTRTTGSIDNISAPPSFVDSFSVVLRDRSPLGLAFSADGTKMFVVGSDQDLIIGYTLATPFDVSTSSFVYSFSVRSQDIRPQGLAFSNDGTKMFVVDDDDDDVSEYALTAPFDISTSAFVDSFSVASHDTKPRGLAFSADGTRMFVVGNDGTDVNEYALTAPFDVSTSAFVDSFSVASEDTRPWGLAFSNDGKKMFVIGLSGKDVNEYALTAPFDVSTSSFTNFFSVALQDTKPRGLAFSADGKKMFVVGNDGTDVNEYTLSKPFTLLPQPNSLASFAATSVKNNIASDTTPPTITAAAVTSLTEIVLTYSENVDVTTTDGEGFTLSVGTVSANTDPDNSGNTITLTISGITASDTPNVTYIESDGTVTDGASNPAASQTFTGTTALPDTIPPTITAAAVTSLTEIVLTYSENVDVNATNGEGFTLSVGTVSANSDPAGSGNTITLTISGITASDTPNVTYTESDGTVTDGASNPAASQTFTGTTPLPDTVPLTITAVAVTSLTEILLTYSENVDVTTTNGEGFTLSVGTVMGNTDPAGSGNTITLTVSGITTSDTPNVTYTESDGTVTDGASNPAADQTFTGTTDDAPPTVLSIVTNDTSTINIVLSEDVTINGAAPEDFALSGTISTDPAVTGITAVTNNTVALALDDTLDSNDAILLAYTKTTGSIDDIPLPPLLSSFPVDLQDSESTGMAFSNDGTRMFVVGSDNDAVYEYTLSAAFDVSTATFVDSFSVASQDTAPRGLAFSADGTKMFVVGDFDNDINEYTLTAPFDVSTSSFVDSFSVRSQDALPRGLAFSADGTKMFVVGDNGNNIIEYTLTAPFDVSTATVVNSFSVASQDRAPRDMALSNDGTRMFVVGNINDAVYGYTLATPFDVSTASFVDSFSVTSQDTFPRGLALSADGTRIFVLGDADGNVHQYALSEPFTLFQQPASLASFAAMSVTNNIPSDTVPPTIIAAAVTSLTEIVLTYSENIDVTTTDGEGFTLSVGQVSANTDPDNSGNTITLTVSGITTSDTPNVIYTESDGTVADTASNPAASQTFTGTTPLPDTVPPTITAAAVTSLTEIVLTYSEDIGVATTNGEGFTLSVGTVSANSDPDNSDSTIILTVSGIATSDAPNVIYTESDGSVTDGASNPAASQTFTGTTPLPDTVPPTITAAAVTSLTEMVLTYSENIDVTTTNGEGFTLSVGTVSANTDPDNSDSIIILTVSGIATSDAPNVIYTESDGSVTDTASNPAEDQTFTGTTPLPDTIPPEITAAAVTSATSIVLTYSENIDVSTTNGAGFTLSDGEVTANTDPAGSDDTITLTVSGITASDAPNVIYTESDGTVADTASNEAASQTFTGTTPLPDTIPPTITAAAVTSATSITLTYSENIDVTTTNGEGFTLSTGQVTANTDPAGSDSTITLTVSGITTSDRPDITYSAESGTVTGSSASIPAASQTFTGTTDDAPPTVSSIETSSALTVDIVLSENVTVNGAAPEDFALSGTISTNPAVTAITAVADTFALTLTLNDALDSNDVISLAYAKTTGSIDDISLTSFVDSFPLALQDISPIGLAFSNSGTKMFVVGDFRNNINEYALAAPFDVSTARYDSSFPVASQDTSPRGLAFSADGTKMFVVGDSGNDINEYALAAPFDVSTATFVDSFPVDSEDTSPRGLAFSDDGTRMFVVGNDDNDINEYALSAPFDVSTASYNDKSFSVASQDGTPQDVAFSNSGTKMFVTGDVGNDVNEYTLTTPFDVSTADFDGSFSVFSQDSLPTGLAFSNDGIRMFVVGGAHSNVHEYTLSKPFTLLPQPNSLASFAATSVTNNVAPTPDDIDPSIDTVPPTITAAAVTFLTQILLTYSENIDVTTTDGTGFALSVGQVTANTDPAGTGNTITLTVSGITASDAPNVIYTESDGTVADSASNPAASQTFAGTTAGTVLTVSSIGTAGTSTIDIVLSEDVTINGAAPEDFALSGTISTDPAVTGITAAADTVTLALNDTLDSNDVINLAYARTTGSIDNIPLPSLASSFSVALEDTFPHGLAFSDDGTRMFVVGGGNDVVYQYALSAPFDVSTASIDVSTASIDDFSLSPRSSGLAFSDDGTRMFVVGDDISQYALTAPFDVSTASFDSSFSVALQESFPQSLAFSANGTRMFVIGDDIYQYTLTAPFDVSTASYDDSSFSVASQESSPRDVAFSANGTRMFVADSGNDAVHEYALTAPFDVSTASYDSSFSISSQDANPRSLTFSADGTRMFVVGSDNSAIHQYALSEPFTLLSPPVSLASFAATPVTNNISSDTVPPAITAAAVTSATSITLTYSENIDVTTTNGQGFALSTGGTVHANTDPGNSDDTITLTVSGITNTSDTPAITYTASLGTVTDTASNRAVDQVFTGTTDDAPPTVFSIATAGASTIDIVLSENVTINGAAPEDFVLSGNITADPAVTGITAAAAADTVTLALDDTLDGNDVILLTYTKTTGSIDDSPSTALAGSFSISSQDEFPIGLAFSNDGHRMFVVGLSGNDVNEYALAVPFDVSTASYDSSFSVSSQDANPRGLAFSANGTSMFVLGGNDGGNVHQYALTSPFDVSNVTGTSDVSHVSSFSISSQDVNPRDLAFSADGTKMFVAGIDNHAVYQYTLTVPFDVSTAAFDDSSFPVVRQDRNPTGLAFSADGMQMFVTGDDGNDINEYALTTPFDVSNVTFVDSFSVESQDSSPIGLTFSTDGMRMFVAGSKSNAVYQYALPEPFSLFLQPNSLASFAAISVTNNIASTPPDGTDPPPDDTVPPAITTAAVTSATEIVLTYSENIDVSTTDGQGFALSVGQVTANTDPAGTDNIITLTVSGITASDTPNVIYTASDGTVTDGASNPAANQTFTGTTDNAPPVVDDTEKPRPEPERKPEKSGRSGGGGGGGGSGRTGVSTAGGGEPLSDIELYGVSWNCETGLIRIITGDDSPTLSVSVRTSIGGLAEASLSDERIPSSKVFTSHMGPSETYLGILLVDIAGRDSNIRNESISIKQCVGEKTYDDASDTPKKSQSQSSRSSASEGDMTCKPGFTLVKNLRDDLACLLDRSVQPLMERGWAESIVG